MKQYNRKQIKEAIDYWERRLQESGPAGNGRTVFNVTLLRDQTCTIVVEAASEEEAAEKAQDIVESGTLVNYVGEADWISYPVQVGDVEAY